MQCNLAGREIDIQLKSRLDLVITYMIQYSLTEDQRLMERTMLCQIRRIQISVSDDF